MFQRTEIKIGVTGWDTWWCWLDSRFSYTGRQVWVAETNADGGMWAPDVDGQLLLQPADSHAERKSPPRESVE